MLDGPLIATRIHLLASAAMLAAGANAALAQSESGQEVDPFPANCLHPVKINFFGDLFVDRNRFRENPFSEIETQLNWADFNVANLEGAITGEKERAFPDFPFALSMSPKVIGLIKKNRIQVTRANNHAMDFGVEGLNDTSAALVKAGISYTGAGKNIQSASRPLTMKTDYGSVGLLAFSTTYPQEAWATTDSAGVAYPTLKRLKQAITEAKKNHDFVVTAFHWGGELTTELRGYQHGLTEAAIEAGSNLVIGHHAHIAQSFKVVKGVPVAFGLGNFLFTSSNKRNTLSLMMHARFCRNDSPQNNDIQVTFTPISTGTVASQFQVIPTPLNTFRVLARPYATKDLFAPDMQIYIQPEKKTMPFSEWMKAKKKE